MEPLTCGHVAVAGESRVCRHLFGGPEGVGLAFFRCLLGDGMRCELRCRTCAEDTTAEVFEVCEGCVCRAEDDGDAVGWRGEPGIAERPEPVDRTILTSPLPAGIGDVVDIAAVAGQPGVWLLLDQSGLIVRWDTHSGVVSARATSSVPDESGGKPWAGHLPGARLYSSADGRVTVATTIATATATATEPVPDPMDPAPGSVPASGTPTRQR